MKIISIVGARPQFIKLAPFALKINLYNKNSEKKIEHKIIHTGQHYNNELSQIFFDELNIPKPDYNLGIGSGLHGLQTGNMIIQLEKVILETKPDMVLIYGDTNSTLAGAVAASKLNIPVAHIEAGLRSFNRTMPEELNRIASDHLSDILFAPTPTALENLKKEGLEEKTFVVGDIMYDSVLYFSGLADKKSIVLKKMNLEKKKFVLATVHRASNTDDINNLKKILKALNIIADKNLPVIFPIHPRTSSKLKKEFPDFISSSNLKIIEPVGYLDMLMLLNSCRLVLTDSGGIQKEAFFLNSPCITLRNETEWVETTTCGANYLAGIETDDIIKYFNISLKNSDNNIDYSELTNNIFGKGNAAEKILDKILNYNLKEIIL